MAERLRSIGAVVVEGAKWCGKTTTCEQIAKSALYMGDPEKRDQYLMLAQTEISRLLEGEHPRLIDEWQDAPRFWDAIRHRVDHENGLGQFVLLKGLRSRENGRIHTLPGGCWSLNVLHFSTLC